MGKGTKLFSIGFISALLLVFVQLGSLYNPKAVPDTPKKTPITPVSSEEMRKSDVTTDLGNIPEAEDILNKKNEAKPEKLLDTSNQTAAQKPESSDMGESSNVKPLYARANKEIPKMVWSYPTRDRVVFITIDDGWYPNEKILDLMIEKHIPISSFITERAAQLHIEFWQNFILAGGDMQNHTSSHPVMTKLSQDSMHKEIVSAQNYLSTYFQQPTLFSSALRQL